MVDEEPEWDDGKAAANARKHGVTFEEARDIFRDPLAIERRDDREAYGACASASRSASAETRPGESFPSGSMQSLPSPSRRSARGTEEW